MRLRACLTAIFLATALPLTHAAEPFKTTDGQPAKPLTIDKALLAITREARDTWEKNKTWPTKESDFSRRTNSTLTNDEVLIALSRKLNPDPQIDGYVKWQLLSFSPDFTRGDDGRVQKILSSLPAIAPQPSPKLAESGPADNGMSVRMSMQKSSVAQPTRGAGSSKLGTPLTDSSIQIGTPSQPGNGAVTPAQVNAASMELGRERKLTAVANMPALHFRDALIEALPEDGGQKLAAMLRDAWDRIAAGEPSYKTAVEKLVRECRKLTDDSPVPPELRASFAKDAERFHGLRTQVTESFRLDTQRKDNHLDVQSYVAEFPADKLKVVLACLRGKPPDADEKDK